MILFDEVEKAHRDVFHVLLQILDDGRVTDSQGRTVDFKNTVLIMTSNIGSERLLEAGSQPTGIDEAVRREVLGALRGHFRPEFLNRIDETVLFEPLGTAELEQIVELLARDLKKRLEGRGLTLELAPEARKFIAEHGYDPVYGARPLKRFLQRELETRIGRQLIAGDLVDGSHLNVELVEGQLAIRAERPSHENVTSQEMNQGVHE